MFDIDTAMALKMPAAMKWSPDGTQLAYQLSGASGSEICTYDMRSMTTTTIDPDIPPFRLYKDQPDLRWLGTSGVVYNKGRKYALFLPDTGIPAVYFDGARSGDLVQLAPDNRRVSFIHDGELWVQSADSDDPAKQLTDGAGLLTDNWQLFGRLRQFPPWSPDSQLIAYLSPLDTGFKVVVVAADGQVVTEFIPEDDVWSQITLTWSSDSHHLAIALFREDFRRKELWILTVSDGSSQFIHADTDDLWVDHNAHPQFDVAWSHDSNQVAFLSKDADGWRHLCIAHRDGSNYQRLTSGPFDLYWCQWLPGDAQLLFVSNEAHHQHRHLYVIDAHGHGKRQLDQRSGMCIGGWYLRQQLFALTPDGTHIAYVHSGPNDAPGIWLADISGLTEPHCIYTPFEDSAGQVAGMEAVRFPSVGDHPVPANLIVADNLEKTRKHPALIYVYGGWDQEAGLGWDFGQRGLFLNYLAHQGYVVLVVDPRGSEGYGYAHDKGLHHDAGGKQVGDLVAAAHYLNTLDYVDVSKVALFGASYGGYMTLQSMVTAPDTFVAGISLAGVPEWSRYVGTSTYGRIRFGSPDATPNLFIERSPIYHLHKLKGKWLILHGTEDFNVPIALAEALVIGLMQAGKDFEYMAYPGEGHSLVTPAAIRDFLLRMHSFLDDCLK